MQGPRLDRYLFGFDANRVADARLAAAAGLNKFPSEVGTTILGYLGPDDPNLKGCRTVCRSWGVYFGWMLFHTVHLSARASSLRRLIAIAASDLQAVVQCVIFHYGSIIHRINNESAIDMLVDGHDLQSVAHQHPSISEALKAIPSVERQQLCDYLKDELYFSAGFSAGAKLHDCSLYLAPESSIFLPDLGLSSSHARELEMASCGSPFLLSYLLMYGIDDSSRLLSLDTHGLGGDTYYLRRWAEYGAGPPDIKSISALHLVHGENEPYHQESLKGIMSSCHNLAQFSLSLVHSSEGMMQEYTEQWLYVTNSIFRHSYRRFRDLKLNNVPVLVEKFDRFIRKHGSTLRRLKLSDIWLAATADESDPDESYADESHAGWSRMRIFVSSIVFLHRLKPDEHREQKRRQEARRNMFFEHQICERFLLPVMIHLEGSIATPGTSDHFQPPLIIQSANEIGVDKLNMLMHKYSIE